jgi:hypothetical protein
MKRKRMIIRHYYPVALSDISFPMGCIFYSFHPLLLPIRDSKAVICSGLSTEAALPITPVVLQEGRTSVCYTHSLLHNNYESEHRRKTNDKNFYEKTRKKEQK